MSDRVCVECRGSISSMRGSQAIYCSSACSTAARKKQKVKRKIDGRVLCHSCLANPNDPLNSACQCKLSVTYVDAARLVANGDAVSSVTRDENWKVGHQLIFFTRGKTPRAATIDEDHMELAYIRGKQYAIDRIEEYGRLTQEVWAKLIVPFRPDPFEGRAIFESGIGDDSRTSVGRTIDCYEPEIFEQEERSERDESVMSFETGEETDDGSPIDIGTQDEVEEGSDQDCEESWRQDELDPTDGDGDLLEISTDEPVEAGFIDV